LSNPEVGVKKAAEIFDEKGKKFIVTLWEDGHITICSEGPEHDCYTSSRPEGERLYYLTQAYYAGLGFKVRSLHGEC
jgi:hypothetical protein